jgi:hypothetical protein
VRLKRVVTLEQGEAIVSELTVGEIRQLMTDFMPNGQLANVTIDQLINEKLEQVLLKTKCLILPENVEINDLSISEITEIVQHWRELHESFFQLLQKMGSVIMSQLKSSQKIV